MNYGEAIAQSLLDTLKEDESVVVMGAGVTDPKHIFGTCHPAHESFPDRVIETPLSELSLTGALVGLSLNGYKPVFVHARADFLTLSMEHLINTAAKWRLTHGSNEPLPLVIRCIVGRGWGQGPQHSQNFAGMLMQVPGIHVLMPTYIETAKSEIQRALGSGKPTVIIESRRLYDSEIHFISPPVPHRFDAQIIAVGDSVIDALLVARFFGQKGVDVRVRGMEVPQPEFSVVSYLPTVVVNSTNERDPLALGVTNFLSRNHNKRWLMVTPPFVPCPTSLKLEKKWYPSCQDISWAVCELLDLNPDEYRIPETSGIEFKGPF